MSDTNNVADTYGGGAHRRRDENRLPAHLMPKQVQPVPTDNPDPGVIADSDKVVEQLTSTLGRHVASTNKEPAPARQTQSDRLQQSTPLQNIAKAIKVLVHDHGEQIGNELEAKMKTNTEKPVSMAKALQLWADDTLTDKKQENPQT